MRHYGRKKKCQYLVKWKGYPDSDNEWVDHGDMNAPEAIQEYEEARKDKSRLCSLANLPNTPMSSSPISVSSNSPTHLETLDALATAAAHDLAKAQVAFPTPEPGRISPNSLDSANLDLTPTTIIRDTSLKAGSLPVAEGTATRSEEEVGSPTEVLVLEYIKGEEGDSTIRCQNPKEASVPFMAPTPKRARLMGTVTSSAGHCSTNVSVTHPPSSPPRQTSPLPTLHPGRH